MNQKVTIEEADRLLEKYYDGRTSNAEEKRLHEFLQQENLPERFDAERAMFGYIAQEKPFLTPEVLQKSDFWLRLNPTLRWILAAAVLISGVFILDNHLQAQKRNVAYIDGIRCTDSKEVTALALASIDQIDLGVDEVAVTVDKMNDKNLVESQLQQFPEIK